MKSKRKSEVARFPLSICYFTIVPNVDLPKSRFLRVVVLAKEFLLHIGKEHKKFKISTRLK